MTTEYVNGLPAIRDRTQELKVQLNDAVNNANFNDKDSMDKIVDVLSVCSVEEKQNKTFYNDNDYNNLKNKAVNLLKEYVEKLQDDENTKPNEKTKKLPSMAEIFLRMLTFRLRTHGGKSKHKSKRKRKSKKLHKRRKSSKLKRKTRK